VAKIVVTRVEKTVMLPLVRPGRWYWAMVGVLAAIVAWAAYAYTVQLQQGLVVTAMRDRISWGLYVSTFVFFIGISHAGTLVSAILRVTNADWRKPITRLAEAITVFALVVGASAGRTASCSFPCTDASSPRFCGTSRRSRSTSRAASCTSTSP